MSYVVISSFENIASGDLQAEGEAITIFPSEAPARAHFASRASALAAAVRNARASDADATFITWLMILHMPLEVGSVEEALEDLELVIEETDSVDDPFGELLVAYEGHRHEPAGDTDYPQKEALQALEAWLT
ncbi:MAG: hypothetical protein GXC76_00450 [Rhodanobacteraceae bacterium]|jgi:hypothetical protein|nr:hypothetical protein [Rhodanobacteraceae bacterium]